MECSSQLRELRARIEQLRQHFLPRTFNPTGTYTKRQFDLARAFRLLVHAEIESYLENIAFDTASKAFDDWNQRQLVTEPLLALVAFVEGSLGDVPKTLSSGSTRDLDRRIQLSRDRFNAYTKGRNHGVRESNVLRLLLPVGISEADIDNTWLSTTNSFAQSRGETAHSSWRVITPPDPQNEYAIVGQILEGLVVIDKKLMTFRLAHTPGPMA